MKNVKIESPEYLSYKKVRFLRNKDWDSITFAISKIKNISYDDAYTQVKTFLNIKNKTKALYTYWTEKKRKEYLESLKLNWIFMPPPLGVLLRELTLPIDSFIVEIPGAKRNLYVPVIENTVYFPFDPRASCTCVSGYWTYERTIKRALSKKDHWPILYRDPENVCSNEYDWI